MADLIQFRRDTAANWTSANPTLAEGELGLETDTQAYKIGDGSTDWNTLPYNQLSPTQTVSVMTNQSSDPSTPSSGYTNLFARAVSGRSLIKYQGVSGLDSPLQPAIFQNSLWFVQPNTTSSVSPIGGAVTNYGTISSVTPAANTYGFCANFLSGATNGSTCGTGQAIAPLNTSSGAITNGGFFFVCRLWFPDADYGSGSTGSRIFVGVTSNTMSVSVLVDDPAGSRAGFFISTNLSETNWMFSTKDGTTEDRNSTGMAFNVNTLYDFYIFVAPGASSLTWRIDDLTNNITQEGSTSTRLPASSTYMRGGFQLATLTTTARNIRMKKIYIETDN